MNHIAKLELTEDGQTVFLPKGVELPGTTAMVRQEGDRLVLEVGKPIPEFDLSTPAGRAASFRKLSADLSRYRKELGEFMPEGREQPPMPPDRDYGWD